jgi:hypothetical protein
MTQAALARTKIHLDPGRLPVHRQWSRKHAHT